LLEMILREYVLERCVTHFLVFALVYEFSAALLRL